MSQIVKKSNVSALIARSLRNVWLSVSSGAFTSFSDEPQQHGRNRCNDARRRDARRRPLRPPPHSQFYTLPYARKIKKTHVRLPQASTSRAAATTHMTSILYCSSFQSPLLRHGVCNLTILHITIRAKNTKNRLRISRKPSHVAPPPQHTCKACFIVPVFNHRSCDTVPATSQFHTLPYTRIQTNRFCISPKPRHLAPPPQQICKA